MAGAITRGSDLTQEARLDRTDIPELHYIAPVSNLPSILKLGLLCHEGVSKLPHRSVAMNEIQQRRSNKVVPNGFRLHQYVNLYFHARNPMLSRLRDHHAEICILRIAPDILSIPNVVITSQNASSNYVRFYPSPDGLAFLDKDLVYAESWIHEDQIDEWRHKSIKCAEVLIPNSLDSVYIMGAYVSNQTTEEQAETALQAVGLNLDIIVYRDLFLLQS